MPVTTFMMQEPKRHKNKEIAELVDELCQLTGEKWFVETTVAHTTKPWFGKPKQHTYTELLKHLDFSEYQVFMCVNTEREALAYLLGALGQLKAKQQ